MKIEVEDVDPFASNSSDREESKCGDKGLDKNKVKIEGNQDES